jgi:hypothetical protein
MNLLAQVLEEQASDKFQQALPWLGVLALVLLVASLVLHIVRKRSQQWQSEPVGPVFTLADVRRLHEEGQISDEEFERLKARIIGQTKQALKQGAQPAERPATDISSPPNQPNGEGESGAAGE